MFSKMSSFSRRLENPNKFRLVALLAVQTRGGVDAGIFIFGDAVFPKNVFEIIITVSKIFALQIINILLVFTASHLSCPRVCGFFCLDIMMIVMITDIMIIITDLMTDVDSCSMLGSHFPDIIVVI